MKKNMKTSSRLISLLLVFVMVLGMFPLSAMATVTELESGEPQQEQQLVPVEEGDEPQQEQQLVPAAEGDEPQTELQPEGYSLQPVDPTQDHSANNPLAIGSVEDFFYLAEAIANSSVAYTWDGGSGTIVPAGGTKVYCKQTADIVLNDESFTFDKASGIVIVTDGQNTGYLGTGMPGMVYNKDTASTAGNWYTEAALTGTLTEGSYGGELVNSPSIGVYNSVPFRGKYDGNGYAIKGYFKDKEHLTDSALFPYLGGGSQGEGIYNVNMLNVCIAGTSNKYAAALLGYSGSTDTMAKIEGCYVEGIVLSAPTASTAYIGGIAAWKEGKAGLNKSGFKGVVGGVKTNASGQLYVGGLVGYTLDQFMQYNYFVGDVYCVNATAAAGIVGQKPSGWGNDIGFKMGYHAGPVYNFGNESAVSQFCVGGTASWFNTSYYDKAYAGSETLGQAKTKAELEMALLELSNTPWITDTNGVNYGYPIVNTVAAGGTVLSPAVGKDVAYETVKVKKNDTPSFEIVPSDYFVYLSEGNPTYNVSATQGATVTQESGVYHVTTAAITQNTVLQISVNAQAGGASATVSLYYELKVNTPPTLKAESNTESVDAIEGHAWSVNCTNLFNTDADGDALSYLARVQKPDAGFTDWGTISAAYSYTPDAPGVYKVELKANDGLEDSEVYQVTLTVADNKVPARIEGAAAEVTASLIVGEAFNFDLSKIFSDGDSDSLSYFYIENGTEKTVNATGTIRKYVKGDYTLVFHATDGIDDSTDTYTVKLTVSDDGIDGDIWNGTVDIRWYTDNPTATEFTLTKPAQLAGLAAIVNGQVEEYKNENFNGDTIKLGADIKLNTVTFSYDKDSARVKISDGTNAFYVASAATGTGIGAPANTFAAYYANSYDTVTAENVNYGVNKLTCNGVTVNIWPIIGASSNSFRGTFDGQNYTISGVYVNHPDDISTTLIDGGLFRMTMGPVKNLKMENGAVFGKGALTKRAQGSLENIDVDMLVMGIKDGSSEHTGGIVGDIQGTLTATNLTFRGVVCGTTDVGYSVSGIAGYLNGAVTMEKCVNYGEVFGVVGTDTDNTGVGGICGKASADAKINQCINRGTVGMLSAHHNVGGICGYSEAQITNCYNTGTVSGTKAVGGLVGYNKAKVSSCYNLGSVIMTEAKSAYGSAIGTGAACDKVFYSKESYIYSAVETASGLKQKTEAEMKQASFAAELGSAFAPDRNNVNNGFPVFSYTTTESTDKQITSFILGDVEGVIDQTNKMILIKDYNVALNDAKVKFAPVIEVSEGATVSPASGTDAEFVLEGADASASKHAEMLDKLPITITDYNGNSLEVQWFTDDADGKGTPGYYVLKDTTSTVTNGTKIKFTNKLNETIKYKFAANAEKTCDAGKTKTLTLTATNNYLYAYVTVKGQYYGDMDKTYPYYIVFQPNLNYEAEYQVTAANGSVETYSVMIQTISDPTSIEMDATASVPVSMTTTIPAVVKPANSKIKTVTWSSGDTSVATVDAESGVITGVSEGIAVITAKVTSGETTITKTATVTVTKFIPLTGISMQETLTLGKRDTHKLVPVLSPADASNQKVTWSSSDETVATVDENGVVTGCLGGSATITATTEDGSFKAECVVTVSDLKVSSIDMTEVKYVAVGSQKKLTAAITPADAVNQAVTWSSSNDAVATVDENGILTGISAGTVDITVTSAENAEIKKTITVTVCEKYEDVYDVQWAGVFNANEANNSINGKNLPTNPEKVTEVWSAEVGNGSAAVVGDYVYTFAAASGMHGFELGGEPGTLYKVNKTTGEVVAATTAGADFTSPLYYAYTIYGGGVIYASTPGGVVAFDPDTMDILWATESYNREYSCAQYVNGYVIVNGCAYNGVTGKTTRLNGSYNYSNGAVAGKYFYVADYIGKIHAFDTETWEELDSLEFKENGTNLQCGVAYADGKLFWGDCMAAYAYAVKIDPITGEFVDLSLQKVNIGYTTTCTPVIYGGRVYLPGQVGANMAVIGVFNAESMQEIYRISDKSGGKIQSTPILYADDVSGAVYVYGQVYGGGAIKILKDTGTNSGEYYQLVPGLAMAFEQMACDSEGALYVTDDSGMLRKIAASTAQVPKFTIDIAKSEIVYNTGNTAEALHVEATVNDGGMLSYQWQKSTDGSDWTDIDGATTNSYVPATGTKGSVYYRCIVKNTLDGEVVSAASGRVCVTIVDKGEETIRVSFRLVGATMSTSGNYDLGATPPVKDSEYITWIATKTYTVPVNTTANELLEKALADANMSGIGLGSEYTSAIYAPPILGSYYLAEFTNGNRSGWMYTINGSHPSLAMIDYRLSNGDAMIFHYVNDYSYEVSDWYKGDSTYPALGDASTWDPWLKVADVNPTKDTPTTGVSGEKEEEKNTVTTETGTTTTPTEVEVSGTTATATITKENVTETIKQATENKSAEIVVQVTESDTKGAANVKVQLDTTTVKDVVNKTEAALTVKTENATVTLDRETLKTVAAEAAGSTVTLEVIEVATPTAAHKEAAGENAHVIQLVIKSGNKTISLFNEGKATVTVEIPTKLHGKKVAAIHIGDDGKIEHLKGQEVTVNGKKHYRFDTPHFSTFALVDADEIGLEVEEETMTAEEVKALIADLTPVARSSKTAKKNVKVTVKLDKADKAIIEELEAEGFNVKYNFYRSTKKSSKYKSRLIKDTTTYTQTGGKKGTKYYYKVRVQVYDAEGKLIARTALKQCRYASRTWSK